METWKDIPGYEGSYQVSNSGRVRSFPIQFIGYRGGIHTTHGKIKKPTDSQDRRYCRVFLSKVSKVKTFSVHRLVAMAFIGDPSGKHVHHIDNNGHNNHLENLAIVTAGENIRYAFKDGLVKDINHNRGGWNKGKKTGPVKQQNCQERPCQQCGKIFLPFLKIQKHCCDKCAMRYGELHRKKRDRSMRNRGKRIKINVLTKVKSNTIILT